MTSQSCSFRTRDLLKLTEKQKKSACKINENDLKIVWKCTLRKSNFKNFPGEAPRTPHYESNPPYTLPLSRLTLLDTCLRQSRPPPHPFFRPSGSSPGFIDFFFPECRLMKKLASKPDVSRSDVIYMCLEAVSVQPVDNNISDNPFYTDTRHNEKNRYYDNLTVTKPSLKR